jgi:hypothetical protein
MTGDETAGDTPAATEEELESSFLISWFPD